MKSKKFKAQSSKFKVKSNASLSNQVMLRLRSATKEKVMLRLRLPDCMENQADRLSNQVKSELKKE